MLVCVGMWVGKKDITFWNWIYWSRLSVLFIHRYSVNLWPFRYVELIIDYIEIPELNSLSLFRFIASLSLNSNKSFIVLKLDKKSSISIHWIRHTVPEKIYLGKIWQEHRILFAVWSSVIYVICDRYIHTLKIIVGYLLFR